LASIPPLALALSRGCGNPTSFARLQEGETVADLGCGGGIDLILAGRRVGPDGRVLGVDFAPEMLERARLCVEESGLGNVELAPGNVESLPLPNGDTDAVISNCVINLVPDKEAVYREAFRVLRPGGRIAISDIVTSCQLEPDLRTRFHGTWAGCLGGAMEEGPYLDLIQATGFGDMEIIARHVLSPEELQGIAQCPGSDFAPSSLPEDIAAVVGKVLSIKFRATR
jgi:SAM-dependent methyltransferase